jgi:hypothetical protein
VRFTGDPDRMSRCSSATNISAGRDRVIGVRHCTAGGSDRRVDCAPVIFGNAAPHRLAEMLPAARRDAFPDVIPSTPSVDLPVGDLDRPRPAAA